MVAPTYRLGNESKPSDINLELRLDLQAPTSALNLRIFTDLLYALKNPRNKVNGP